MNRHLRAPSPGVFAILPLAVALSLPSVCLAEAPAGKEEKTPYDDLARELDTEVKEYDNELLDAVEAGEAKAAADKAAAATGEAAGELQMPPFLKEFKPGPATAKLGSWAEIPVPESYIYTGKRGAKMMLEALGNPADGSTNAILMPGDLSADWFLVFTFEDIGYVSDEDKDDLDADDMLASLQEGTEHGNELRRKRGWPTIRIDGWVVPPHYDDASQNLEWGTLLVDESGNRSLNYKIDVLGRRGVMHIVLVANPEGYEPVLEQVRSLIKNFEYKDGQEYAAFEEGDKIAEYGLAALIAGGAAAVALKTGFFQKFWKLLAAGFAALAAGAAKLFGFGKKGAAAPAKSVFDEDGSA